MVADDDLADIDDPIDRTRERIRRADNIDAADTELLIDFSKELSFRQSDYSQDRHLKLLTHCTILAGDHRDKSPDQLPDTRLADALEDEEAAKDLVRWIHDTYDNPETNRDFRAALRMFGLHVTDGEGRPPSIDQISSTLPKSHNPMPDPAKMYRWERHILPMVDAVQSDRDRALVTVGWDAGLRSGEICALTIGDVTDARHGLSISVDGKMGQRSVTLIPSVPYLQQWLARHPRSDDPTAPLWCNTSTGEDISYRGKLRILDRAAERADMRPPSKCTFTRLRKSSASYLASQGVNQAHLEDHHGWKRGSDVAARYIAVFSEESEREIARAHGVDVSEDESDPTAPVECFRCDKETPRERDRCIHCGQALSHEATEQAESDRAAGLEAVGRAVNEGHLSPDEAAAAVADLTSPEAAAKFGDGHDDPS